MDSIPGDSPLLGRFVVALRERLHCPAAPGERRLRALCVLRACVLASLAPALAAHQGPTHLEGWRPWWSMNRGAVLPALPPLTEAAREEIAETLHHMVEAPARATDLLLPEALQAWANVASSLPEARRAHARLVCEANLEHTSIAVRERAAFALGLLGGQHAFALLTDLALDTPRGRELDGRDGLAVPESVRAYAVHGLGMLGAESDDPVLRRRVVQVLWDVCEGPLQATPEVRRAAVLGMGVVALEDGVSTAGSDPRPVASGPPTTRDEQIRYLFDLLVAPQRGRARQTLRYHAPRGLVLLINAAPEWKAPLVDALLPYATKRGAIGVREMRRAAVLALGSLGDLDADARDASIRSALMESSKNADLMMKCFSVLSLGRIGARPGSGTTRGAGEVEVREFLDLQVARGKTQLKPWAALARGLMEFGLQRADGTRPVPQQTVMMAALETSAFRFGTGANAIGLGLARPAGAEDALRQCLRNLDSESDRSVVREALSLLELPTSAEGAATQHAWQDLLSTVQTRATPIAVRRAALEKLNVLIGGGETRWVRLFARDVNVLACGPVLIGARRPGLLYDPLR